jgi:hypothetical protein
VIQVRKSRDSHGAELDILPHEHDEARCPAFDGKRCGVLGHRPGSICEPAVREISRQADDWKRRATAHGCQEGGDPDCG